MVKLSLWGWVGKGREERTGALWAGFLGDLGRGFIFTEPKIKIKLEIVKRMGFEVRELQVNLLILSGFEQGVQVSSFINEDNINI